MIRILIPAVAAVVAASLMTGVRQNAMATGGISQLRAFPERGHSGDPIYLSGSIPDSPDQQLTIMMACPNWYAQHVWDWQNARLWANGPVTDRNGEFAGFRLPTFELHVLTSSGCTIYTGDAAGFGPDIPALYSIAPPDERLKPLYTHIFPRVTVKPKIVRQGELETVSIDNGWGGAHTTVTISVPGALKTLKRTVTLNWKGSAVVPIRVSSGAGSAEIRVHCKLGRFAGDARSHFKVLG